MWPVSLVLGVITRGTLELCAVSGVCGESELNEDRESLCVGVVGAES